MHDPAETKPSQQKNDTKDDEKKLVTAPEAKQVEKLDKESEKSASAVATTKPTGGAVDMDETKKDHQNDDKNKDTSLESGINSEKGVEGAGEAEESKGDDGDVEMKDAPSGTESAVAPGKESEPEAMEVETGEDDKKQENVAESSDKTTSTVNAGETETTKPQDESKAGDVAKKDDSVGSTDDKPKETTTEKNGGDAVMEEAKENGENKNGDAKLAEKPPSTENQTASEATEHKQDSETKATMQGETTKADTSTVNGTGGTAQTDGATATPSAAPPAAVSAGSSAPPAAAAGPPPPPVLRGTLSYNLDLKRHVIRGMWNYENSTAFPPQRFELIRNLDKGEDPMVLPKDGEFHGSFSLAYYHTTSKGKQKERSKVIPESGVNIKFTKIDGKDDEYNVDGQGTNQFGVFNINGTAQPSPLAGDRTYDIELRKRYVPSQVPVAPPASASVSHAAEKKNKKRKHEEAGGVHSDASMDDDKTNDVKEGEPLPPPSQSFPSNVVCLQGKIYREESDELGLDEVVHRISGMWSSGLDLIAADPQNVRGLCNRFEYEHKSTLPNDRFPVSGRYSGWFDLSNPDGTRTRITEKDVTLKFRKNSEGFYNVEGRGSNAFGKYSITGSLTNDNVITIFRHFQQRKAKKSKDSSNKSVTSAPGPLHGSGQPKAAVPPPEPKLKLDDVKLPDDADDTEKLSSTPLPVHGSYSAISRGVMRLSEDGAVICSGKWAMTREHYNNGQISAFSFRLEPHFAAEAVAAMQKNEKGAGGNGRQIFSGWICCTSIGYQDLPYRFCNVQRLVSDEKGAVQDNEGY